MPGFRFEKEFDERVIQVRRVSKKTKGGNKISFSVLVVVGDKKGKVGFALGKAPDVRSAIHKAIKYAKKNMIKVPLKQGTIPHEVRNKYGAAKIILKPAPLGAGIIAGGAIRSVVEVAGVENIVGKILGTKNNLTNVYATMEALKKLRK